MLAAGRTHLYASTPQSVLLSAVAAGLFNMVALVAVVTAFSLTSVASASAINSLQVGLAPLLAWAALGERLNITMIAGILLILTGVLVVQRVRATEHAGDD
jgi:drug/metabolite transporter (DMT)-like permease